MTASPEGSRVLPRLHLVTDDRVLADPGFVATARALAREGGDRVALHLRGPRTSGRKLYELAASLRGPLRDAGALLLLNDRIDVGLASDADGVQLGARGLELADARRLGAKALLGLSVHSAAEATAALAAGADFVLAGTLFESASHPDQTPGGSYWLREIEGGAGRVIGIGGITPARVPQVLRAGAHGVAAIRAVWDTPRPMEAIEGFLKALYERHGID